MAHILIVEDEGDIRRLFSRALERRGHTTDLAAHGAEAVELVEQKEYDLILTDVRMPHLNGLEFLATVQPRIESKTPCVIVTAFDDSDYAIRATRLGVRDFLVKPFEMTEFYRVVGSALELREDWRFRHERQRWLEEERLKLERERRRLERELLDTLLAFLSEFGEQLESTVHAKDHCRRVAQGAVDLARACGVEDEAHLRGIRLGAILHDIGKIKIDPVIWRKGADEPLTEADWAQIRLHPERGAEMVEKVPRLTRAATIVRHHHERFDGGGYPDGLAGHDIPLEARIFMVIDAYDCMVDEHRRYKKPKTPRQALQELKRCVGSQFDPDIVRAFEERVFPRLEQEWQENGGRVPVNGQVEGDFTSLLLDPDPEPEPETTSSLRTA